MARAPLAFVRLSDAGAAIAVVEARAAVELVGAGAAVEAVVAGTAVAAVFARPHVTDVPSRPAPTAVAAGALAAVAVAGPADAVGVLRSGDAEVVAATTDAAVAPRPFRIADVLLAVADELVLAGPQVGGERKRHPVEHFDQIAVGTGSHFDRAAPCRRADGVHARDEPATPWTRRRHIAVDDDVFPARRQPQVGAGARSVDDDRRRRGGRSGRGKQTEQGEGDCEEQGSRREAHPVDARDAAPRGNVARWETQTHDLPAATRRCRGRRRR